MSEGPNHPDDRAALAEQQQQLVAALANNGDIPAGMDASRVALAARSLHVKRARAVAKTWGVLRQGLSARFDPAFTAYAQANALPDTGPLDDGRAFAEWLARAGLLDDAGRLHLLFYKTRHGWPLRAMRLPNSGRIAIALRLPWRGIRTLQIRLPFAKAIPLRRARSFSDDPDAFAPSSQP
jgi:hypothetical protein